MKKRLNIFLSLTLFLVVFSAYSTTGDDTKKDKPQKESIKAEARPSSTRQFKSLDPYTAPVQVFDNLNPEDFQEDLTDTLEQQFQRALELEEYLKNNNRFVEVLDEKTLVDLPVGIKKEMGGLTYSISLDSIVMTPTSAYLIAYMVFEIPSSGKKIAFRGSNIKISKTGGISGGNARLELIGDQSMNLFSEKTLFTLKGDGTTFVEFDCNGYKSMGVGAEITFSRDVLIPDNGSATDRVKTNFITTLSNWNDLIVEVDVPDFQVTKLKDFSFSVNDAVFDFSDYRNAPAVKFPDDYQSPALMAGETNLWRGFYLRELSVRLPSQFEKNDGSGRTSFAAYNVIIDNMGFTGFLEGKNLIETDKGNMSGWAYSLDSLGIDLMANQIREAGLHGDIVVPINKEDTPFAYSAIINPGNEYLFNVTTSQDIQFEVFKTSRVEIYEASYLEIRVADGKFLPKANLHGTMDIDAPLSESSSSKKASLANISFENLEIQTVKPYIQIGAFSFGSERAQQAMAKFPVSINNIGLRTIDDDEVGLDFDLIVNLNDKFGGEAGLTIVGKLDQSGSRQKWKAHKLQVNDIMVDIDQGAFKFYGRLQFFRDDLVYGNGFNGVLDARFEPGITVQATAIFGSVEGMRFWYADALATFPTALPVLPPLGINGFGGGAYYHMKMDNEGVGSDFGKTASGVVYVPDAKTGLGLKATVALSTVGSETVINGDATFEVVFFKGGGVRSITFTGNMFVLTPPIGGDMMNNISEKTDKMVAAVEKYEGKVPGGVLPDDQNTIKEIHGEIGAAAGARGNISAHVKFVFDFENKSIHGNMEMFANVAGGLIRGVGPGGRAGWAVIHYDPSDWYFYLGTPDDRVGVSAGVGPIRTQLTSYFMVGTKIPGSPPPSEVVSEILGGIDLDYMRDENAIGLGKGFAFGSAMAFDTGDLRFLMFYARLRAGLGFDIMLKNYGDNVRCKGRSEPLGINGWYANGQAYAYFDGKIGIRVKVFGKRKSVDILNIGAAAVLQAKLPNPFWMRGIVGGHFSVLGGLVKGNCRFEVTIGEECEMVGGSVLQGIEVIAEVTPNNGEKEVSVFNTPQAVFNMPINKTFEMIDVDDKKKSFRIKLDEFSVIYNGSQIPGDLEWNATNDVVAFNAFDVFPSEKELKGVVQVSFVEFASGQWVPVYVDGKKYVENSEVKFTSGVAPDYIPLNNVAYSYPVINQVNFYKGESNDGYIKLKKGQPYLFDVNQEWQQKGRFNSPGVGFQLFDFKYSSPDREVQFIIPDDLQNNKIYSYALVNIPKIQKGKVDRNVKNKVNKIRNEGQEIDTEVTTKVAEGVIDDLQEKNIFTSVIRISNYNTLNSKLNAADMTQQWRWPIRNGVHELGKAIIIQEVFDNAELNGINGKEPLIQLEAALSDNEYYKDYMEPLIYDGYPIQGRFSLTWRDPVDEIGVPPVGAVFIRQHPNTNLEIEEKNLQLQNYSFYGLTSAFIYNLSHFYQRDLYDLRNQAADYYADSGGGNERIQKLLTTPFPRILGGPYKVKVKYVIPGKNKVTSEQIITITNPVE